MKKLFTLLVLLCFSAATRAQTYCTPAPSSASAGCSTYGMDISEFSLDYMTDMAGCTGSGYLNQTSMTCSLTVGATYTVTINTNTTSYNMNCQVWIDFNRDGTFQTTESVGGLNSYRHTSSGDTFSITIPAGAPAGSAQRIRVVTTYAGLGYSYPSIDPCMGGYAYGEARDYTNIPFAATTTTVFCTPAPSSASSGCSSLLYNISSFRLRTIHDTYSCTGSGYIDQTSMGCSLTTGTSYTATINTGTSSSTMNCQAWIDFNHDIIFQASESVGGLNGYTGSSAGSTFNITVPAGAPTGSSRLRIVTTNNSSGYSYSSMDPCMTSYTYGEARDYSVSITSGGGSAGAYCTPAPGSASSGCSALGYDISEFNLGCFTDLASCDGSGYLNQTALMCTLNVAGTYTATINTTTTSTMNCQVWIDFNNDATFQSSESVGGLNGYAGSSSGSTFTITVPSGVPTGMQRIRIVATNSSSGYSYPSIDPCMTSYTYGEARDYIAMLLPASVTYCTPAPSSASAGCSSLLYNISEFSLRSIHDTYGCTGTGYINLTSMSCTLTTGTSYTATINTGTTSSNMNCQAWIDFNNDRTFQASESVGGLNGYTGSTAGSTFTIAVPSGAATGSFRLRVVTTNSSSGYSYPSIDPCMTSYTYGEARDYSVGVTGGSASASPYCTPAPGSASSGCSTLGYDISEFSLGFTDVANCDGSGYLNLTAVSCSLSIAATYTATVNTTTTSSMNCQVWIDFNNDATFQSSESVGGLNGYAASSAGSTFTITVPSGVPTGVQRMRIVATNSSSGYSYPTLDPCMSGYTYGEARDYTDYASGPSYCTGTPAGGTASATTTSSVSCAFGVTLTNSGYTTTGTGISLQWQSSPSGSSSWANISGATNATEFIAAPTIATDYRCVVTCTPSSSSANSTNVTVSPDKIYGHISYSTTAPDTMSLKVWLIYYNVSAGTLYAVDSVTTCLSGSIPYYEFNGVTGGNYLVKARSLDVTSSTPGSSGFLPTYGASSPAWSGATAIGHTSGVSDSLHIHMAYGTVTAGPGFIGGLISSGAGKGTTGDVPAAGMLVYLKSVTSGFSTYTFTNSTGAYSFNGLAYGSYIIYPEKLTDTTIPSATIILNSAHTSVAGINFKEYTGSKWIKPITTSIPVKYVAQQLSIFPNPTSGELNINWSEAITGNANVVITDMTGREVFSTAIDVAPRSGSTHLQIPNINNGIYLVKIITSSFSCTEKLTVQH